MNEAISNQEYAKGLREIADFYEDNDDLPQVTVSGYLYDVKYFLKAMVTLSRGGKVEKDMGNPKAEYSNVTITRNFSGVPLSFITSKDQVCKRVVSWECPDSLLALAMNRIEKEL